jgi:hypothetical protein
MTSMPGMVDALADPIVDPVRDPIVDPLTGQPPQDVAVPGPDRNEDVCLSCW